MRHHHPGEPLYRFLLCMAIVGVLVVGGFLMTVEAMTVPRVVAAVLLLAESAVLIAGAMLIERGGRYL